MGPATPSSNGDTREARLGVLERVLGGGLEALRERVGGGDPDRFQVALDELVWCDAHLSAARAAHQCALAGGERGVARLADLTLAEAEARLGGSPVAVTIARGELAAEPAEVPIGLGDAGASAEHRLLRSEIRTFAERELAPHAQRVHLEDRDVPEAVISGAAELGLFGLSIPLEYGGSQGEAPDSRAMLVVTEELSRASLAAGGSLITRPEILVRALLRGGTPEQRRRWLPDIASGRRLVAVAVTEPDTGSDVAAVACRARPVDGGWELSGAKLWCTFAGRAELLMVLARTSDDGHRGLSVFVLEKPAFAGHAFSHRSPLGGKLDGRAIPTIGYRGLHTFELAFDGLRLPAEALVGGGAGIGRGFHLQMEGFAMGRLQTAGRAVGVMQAALEQARAYTSARTVFGSPVAEFQLARAKLGTMAARVHAARQLSYAAARELDAGGGQVAASVAKLYASRMAELVTREAMQLHGAMGYGAESEVSRLFLDARVLSIFEGAEEVLALKVIGRALLAGGRS